jgi:gluconokinase
MRGLDSQCLQAMKRNGVVIVLMGVSGSGKSTIGSLLAQQLGWEFADADDYHSAANVEKMRNGIPLTDADRAPWLDSLRSLIAGWIAKGNSGVLACSALKQAYREKLLVNEQVRIVYLKVSDDLLAQRLLERQGHYMKKAILESQLATLEEPSDAVTVNEIGTPEKIVRKIRRDLKLE